MRKYFLFFIFIFISCSQSFIEETQDVISMRASVSNDLDTGILLGWHTQWDFARTEMLRGEDARSLSVFKNSLVQSQLLDSETKPGRDYYYQIRAYNSKDRMIGQSSIVKGYRNYRNIDAVLQPTELKTEEGSYVDKIELYWIGDVYDVFRVYRSPQLNGPYDLITEITFEPTKELTFVDKNLKPASTYYYKVSAVGLDSDTGKTIKEKYGKAPTQVEGSTKYAPTGLKASVESMVNLGGIELTWNVDPVAEYYQLSRASEEDGEYKVIAPYIDKVNYIDNTLPNKVGTIVEDSFVYPSYFYKVKSIASGEESGFSAPAEGKAINPIDILDAPKSFELALDKSKYPYDLTLSWDAVNYPKSSTPPTYRLSKINENNKTEIILVQDNITTTDFILPNEAIDTRWEYIVQAINLNAGDRPGFVASINYISATPAPPILNLVSQDARLYTTNTIYYDKPKETHVYWKKGWPSYKEQTSMTGIVTEEWTITSSKDDGDVGFIELQWKKLIQAEKVNYYSVYRRKKGDTEFTKISGNSNPITENFKDKNLPEYAGTKVDDKMVYPEYEYYITAWYNGQESGLSAIKEGSAVDPEDILEVPSYLTVPFHWASGFGFQTTIKKGDKSPLGIDQEGIIGKGVGPANTMYLTWNTVSGAISYKVRHARGMPTINNDTGEDTTSWYTHNPTATKQYFNNDITTANMTGLYVAFDIATYVKNTATFNVVPVNQNGVLGNERGIVFEEPPKKPAYY